MSSRSVASILVALALIGCGDDVPTEVPGTTTEATTGEPSPPLTTTGASTSGNTLDDGSSSGGTSEDSSTGAPVDCGLDPTPVPLDLCLRMRGGPAGTSSVPNDLARAHASVRFFAPITAMAEADDVLVSTLSVSASSPDLLAYPDLLPGLVCALPAESRTLGPAQVELRRDVAWVTPGTGPVARPEGAAAVVIDLRGLPSGDPDLRSALDAAAAIALDAPLERVPAVTRRWLGLRDELFSATNVYDDEVIEQQDPPIPGSSRGDLPLVLLTEAVMPAEAVELAAALRVSGKASIFGEDLLVAVAETSWEPVGTEGLAYRHRMLGTEAQPLPDVITANVRATDPGCLIESAADVPDGPGPFFGGNHARAPIVRLDGFGQWQDSTISAGVVRAALVSARGAIGRFFPPYPTQDLDARLEETLAAVDAAAGLDRAAAQAILRRFSNALDDGHSFVFDDLAAPAGYMLVQLEDIDGEAVVRRSAVPGISPGDAITSIGGVPAATWFSEQLATTSAASDGYRFLVAARRFTTMDGDTEIGVRDPDGVESLVMVTPASAAERDAFGYAPVVRPSGYLDDLGAPSVYYLNLADDVTTLFSQVTTALTQAQGATGLVVDMRGYPGVNHYQVAQRLIDANFQSPQFLVPTWDGPWVPGVDMDQYAFAPLGAPNYHGPIALLVGHSSVSAAENFSLLLVDAGVATVVGRSSAATNGNITAILLPGGFGLSFTGMELLHADGSDFHGIGIVPDVAVDLSAADLRDGIDPELMAAIAVLP